MAHQISVSPVQSDGKCSSYVVSAAGTDKTFKCGKGGASSAYNRAYTFAKRIVKGFIAHEHAFDFVAYRPDSSLETSFSWSKTQGIHNEKTGEKGVTAATKKTAAKKKTPKSSTDKLVASAKAKIASLTDKLSAVVAGKTPKKKTAKTAKKTGTKKTSAPAVEVPKAAASEVAEKRKAAKKSPKAVAAKKAVARSSVKAPKKRTAAKRSVPAGVGGLPSAASLAAMPARKPSKKAAPKAARSAATPKAKAKTSKRKSSK